MYATGRLSVHLRLVRLACRTHTNLTALQHSSRGLSACAVAVACVCVYTHVSCVMCAAGGATLRCSGRRGPWLTQGWQLRCQSWGEWLVGVFWLAAVLLSQYLYGMAC